MVYQVVLVKACIHSPGDFMSEEALPVLALASIQCVYAVTSCTDILF